MKFRKVLKGTYNELTSSPFVPAFVVFLAISLLLANSWRTAKQDIVLTTESLIEERAVLSEASVIKQVQSYENALLSGRGFIESSEAVTRDEWENFVKSMDLKSRREGVLGLGYVEFVKPENVEAYQSNIRSQGFPDFRIWPFEEGKDIYSSITYIAPFDDVNSKAFGFNGYSEETRRTAMDRAVASGLPTMTSKIKLVQTNSERLGGLNLYQALYRDGMPTDTEEQRKQAVTGFIYSPFITNQLFASVFKEDENQYNVKVYDGDTTNPDKLLYVHNKDNDNFIWSRKDTIDISGVTWTFQFGLNPNMVPESVKRRPNSLAIGGTIFATLVAAATYFMLQQRKKSLIEKEEKRVQRAKDNMLSLASHQLRTPATGVKQYVGMVLEGFTGDITPEQEQMLKNAYDSNERQLRIINEFLYLAKAEADRIVISPQAFDLTSLVGQIVEDMHSDAVESGHIISVKVPKKNLMVTADIHSARMIIENLISNAIKYTAPGGKILVTVKKKSEHTIVEVKDNGVGIDEEDIQKLFQQFSRIPNELTKTTSGSGIGLYIAKILAELNDGFITVESTPHKGSKFSMHFPDEAVKNLTEQSGPKS